MNLGVRLRSAPDSVVPFVLSIVAVGILLVSGWLGWKLVYEHCMGLAEDAELMITTRRGKDHAA